MRCSAIAIGCFALLIGGGIDRCNGLSFESASAGQLGAERRGCCSHHGGVCGCQKGRALCCNGQLSPSCGCD